jgi:quercetin dioxygenase-like cupin family protein
MRAGTMTEQWTMPMDSSLYILEGAGTMTEMPQSVPKSNVQLRSILVELS